MQWEIDKKNECFKLTTQSRVRQRWTCARCRKVQESLHVVYGYLLPRQGPHQAPEWFTSIYYLARDHIKLPSGLRVFTTAPGTTQTEKTQPILLILNRIIFK